MVSDVPDGPCQWKLYLRPGLPWGPSLLPPPTSPPSARAAGTALQGEMEFRPQETKSLSRVPGWPRSTYSYTYSSQRVGCGGHLPLPEGLDRVSGRRPRGLVLGLHTWVGSARNNDQVRGPRDGCGMGLGKGQGTSGGEWRWQERGLGAAGLSTGSGFESCIAVSQLCEPFSLRLSFLLCEMGE